MILSNSVTDLLFSSSSLIVLALTFNVLICFEFTFVAGVRKRSRFILLHFDVQLSQHYLCGKQGGRFFSPFNHFGKNQLTFNVRVYFWTFISIPLISESGSVPALHGLSCGSFFLFIRMPFIAFSCRISLAGTSSTMLNTGGKSRRHRLVSDLWGKEFSLSALSVVSAVGFSRCPLPGWGSARPSLVIWVLLSRNDVGFCQIFSVSTDMVMSLSFFCPLLVCGVYDNWCGDGEPSLH